MAAVAPDTNKAAEIQIKYNPRRRRVPSVRLNPIMIPKMVVTAKIAAAQMNGADMFGPGTRWNFHLEVAIRKCQIGKV